MPGLNTTGKSKTKDYTIGRGVVMLSKLDAFDIPGEYREVGNAKTLRINAESETIEHFSSQTINRVKDAEVALETSADVELTIDELNFDNLAAFFVGEAGSHANPDLTTQVDDGRVVMPNNDAALGGDASRGPLGRWYELWSVDGLAAGTGLGPQLNLNGTGVGGTPSDNRIYRIDSAADITITVDADAAGAGAPNDYVGGVDFEVNLEEGLVFLPDDGSAFALDFIAAYEAARDHVSKSQHILTGEYLLFSDSTVDGRISVSIAAQSNSVVEVDEMRAFTAASQAFALKYVLLNANDNGHHTEVQIHKIKLVPNGDLSLLTEDAFAELTLTGSAEQNVAGDADSGFVTMRTART